MTARRGGLLEAHGAEMAGPVAPKALGVGVVGCVDFAPFVGGHSGAGFAKKPVVVAAGAVVVAAVVAVVVVLVLVLVVVGAAVSVAEKHGVGNFAAEPSQAAPFPGPCFSAAFVYTSETPARNSCPW